MSKGICRRTIACDHASPQHSCRGHSIAGLAITSFVVLSTLEACVTLLERAPSARAEGQNIDLRYIECVRHLELEKSIRAHLTGEKRMTGVDERGRANAPIAASKHGETPGPMLDIELIRGTLARLLVQSSQQWQEVAPVDTTTTSTS